MAYVKPCRREEWKGCARRVTSDLDECDGGRSMDERVY